MKKKNLLFVLFIAIFFTAKSQPVLLENFDSTPDGAIPTGWTRFNVDGLTPYYSWITNAWVALNVSGTSITTKAAWSTSYYSPAGVANDWMFTPPVVIPVSNPILQFTEYTPNSSYPDGYEVRIMTTAPTTSNLTSSTVLLSVSAASTTPTTKTINLSTYAGQTVYIGWRNNSNDKLILAIDDIVIKSKYNNDIALTSINTPSNVAFGNSNITGTIKNVGLNAITSYDVTYKINNGSISPVYSVTGQNIAIGATSTFTHNVPAYLPLGFDTITVSISNINGLSDSNDYDNVLTKIVNSLPDNNIALTTINTPSMLGAGNSNISGTVKNMSVTPINSYDVTYRLDSGAVSAVYSVTGQNITFNSTANFTHNIPANFTIGNHTIEVTISNVNGTTDPDTTNNVLIKSISVSSSSQSRKVLVEEFSTEKCPNCPPVATYLHGLANADTNIVMMVHHAGYYTDPYTIAENTTMLTMFNAGGSTYAPAGMIDRYYWNADMDNDGTIDPGPVFWPGTPYGGNAINARKEYPAFVDVNISGTYNITIRELTVTVSGNITRNYSNIGVSLWITQDNITSSAQAGYTGTWTHHNVIRDAISGTWGDAITTPTTDGSSYTKTFTYIVNSAWDLSNLHLVAMVNQIDANNVNNRTVLNVNTKKVDQLQQFVSVSEIESDKNFNIYPNPAKENVQISYSLNESKDVNIYIYNALGALVYSQNEENMVSGNHTANLSIKNLSKGIYQLTLRAGENTITKKLIVQ